MRRQELLLPGRSGQSVFCDSGNGLYKLLEALAKGMKVQSLTLRCVAGAGVGKMLNPSVRQFKRQFTIRGELTWKPGEIATFRCFLDGHVPRHQELTTIGEVQAIF